VAFRKLMARLGAGGAGVETVLDQAVTTPGSTVGGRVTLTGGSIAQDVEEVRVALQATVEVESGDHEWREEVTFASQPVTGRLQLQPGQTETLPFALQVPWQCPITTIDGWQLRGARIGVRTRAAVAGAVDPGDLDPLEVAPLPVQRAVIDALTGLGFRFRTADVEKGRLPGSDVPFYQEVEFSPGGVYAGRINELEVTFLADGTGMDVVLEADRRGGFLSSGYDAVARLRLAHTDTDVRRLAPLLDEQVRHLGSRRGWF
jgi:sporulation-control protein